jgi:hypothetical protein
MAKPLKSLAKPDARILRELAGADPLIPPALGRAPGARSSTSASLLAWSISWTLRLTIPQPDLEDRTPRRRRDRREAA